MEKKGNMRKGLLMAMGAGVCWGATGLFGTLLFAQGFEPLAVASARLFFAFITFAMVFLPKRYTKMAVSKKDLLLLALFSFIGITLFNVFYLEAVGRVGISVAVVLLYTSPLFVVLFSSVFLGERITRSKVNAIALLLIGTFFVVEAYQVSLLRLNFTGIVMGLGAGLAFSLLSIFSKIALVKADQITKIFYMFFFGSIYMSLIYPPWRIFEQGISAAGFLALAGLVLISTLLAYTLYILALSHLEAGKASIAVALEPVSAILFAFVFLKDVLSVTQYLGVTLVLLGILLVSYTKG